MLADAGRRCIVVGQPVDPLEARRNAVRFPARGRQEQLAAARRFVVQRQDERAEHEIEQTHRTRDLAHQQPAARLEQRREIGERAADVLRRVDHVRRDDQVVAAGFETLRAGVLLQIEDAIAEVVAPGELLFGAPREDWRNIGEVVADVRLAVEFGQQPRGRAAGAAADFEDAQRAVAARAGPPFAHEPRDDARRDLVEVAAEAEVLVQHPTPLDALSGKITATGSTSPRIIAYRLSPARATVSAIASKPSQQSRRIRSSASRSACGTASAGAGA